MFEKIKVIVSGSSGKMGQEVVKMVENDNDLKLVGMVDLEPDYSYSDNIYIGSNLLEGISISKPDVLVDFTHPSIVLKNTLQAIEQNVAVVVGTTGLKTEDLDLIHMASEKKGVGVLVAPNFAIGAILMVELSRKIAEYFSEVEIIEMHNPLKADSPSGTALRTAEIISKSLKKKPTLYDTSEARGKIINKIPIHSVRLPGLVAHQQVIFGGQGQTLTIKHDSYDRTSFMPGVRLAIKRIIKSKGLIYGLENLIDI